jgi:hypothetical protein
LPSGASEGAELSDAPAVEAGRHVGAQSLDGRPEPLP